METKTTRWVALVVMCLAVVVFAYPLQAEESPADATTPIAIPGVKNVFLDPPDDYVMRRCDADPTVHSISTNGPEFIYATIGRWDPVDAYADRYYGNYNTNGGYARIDMVFDGLVNPPGTVLGSYMPAKYGPNPLFAWMELDMDVNANTGGDTDYEFLGYHSNVARFGGIPKGERFVNRIGIDGYEWNGVFGSLPATYRDGADLSYRFQGDWIEEVNDIGSNGDKDQTFEPGETWIIETTMRNAYGYDRITYSSGYGHLIQIRFHHSIVEDRTTICMVLPLTNYDYAILNNEMPVQSNDFSSLNASSAYEYLGILYESAFDPFPEAISHPHWPLLAEWGVQDPLTYIDPSLWRFTIYCSSTTHQEPSGGTPWVLSDVWPNPVIGDFNGDGLVSESDRQMMVDYIAYWDGNGQRDADGTVNSIIDIVDFPYRYSVYDTDYDGFVSTAGFAHQSPGDYDNDGDVDLADYRMFQLCFSPTQLDAGLLDNVGCLDAFDDDDDLDIDLADLEDFTAVLMGP